MQVFASKDAEIEDLKKRLKELQQQHAELVNQHATCPDLIASLRKQLATVQESRDSLQRRLSKVEERFEALQSEHAKCPPLAPPRICGVGMLLEAHAGHEELWVTQLVPGLPAQQCAQIQLHDVLYKVDQTIVSGWDLDDVCNLIKGIIRIVSTQMLIPMHIRQSVKILPSRPMYSSAY